MTTFLGATYPMPLKRYLDDLEYPRAWMLPALVVEFSGDIEPKVIARAFKLLAERHPVLLGRISIDESGYLLEVPPEQLPNIMLAEGDLNTFLRQTILPLDLRRSVYRLIMAKGHGQSWLALQTTHAVADAVTLGSLMARLLSIYADLLADRHVRFVYRPILPVSPRHLLTERWGALYDHPDFRLRHLDIVNPDMPSDSVTMSEPQRLVTTLSPAETSRLVAAGRKLGTSVHALLCGSLITSLRRSDRRFGSIDMTCISIVNLRDRTTPRVGSTETTNFNASHFAKFTVTRDADAVAIARQLKQQLTASIDARRLQPPLGLLVPVSPTPKEQRISYLNVTNPGVTKPLPRVEGLEATDYFWSSSSLPTAISGPPLSLPVCAVGTFGGVLSLQAAFPDDLFTYNEAEGVLGEATDVLRQIADRSR
jgi:hypothetical protein